MYLCLHSADVHVQTTTSTARLVTETDGNVDRTEDDTSETGIDNTLFLGLVVGIPVGVTAIVICAVVLNNQLRIRTTGIPNAATTINPTVGARPPAALARHDGHGHAWMVGTVNRPGPVGNRAYFRQNPANVYFSRYGNQKFPRLASIDESPTPGYDYPIFVVQPYMPY